MTIDKWGKLYEKTVCRWTCRVIPNFCPYSLCKRTREHGKYTDKLGQALYGKFCASCHGVDLKGTKQGPPFLHRVYHPGHHSDGSFFLAAKNGARAHHWKFGDMKPVEGVNESIVASIVKYVRHVQKLAGLF